MSTARQSLSPTNSIDTTSFLSHRNHQLVRCTLSLRCGVRFLCRASNNHMMRVREAAAEQLEERQSDWAYSLPIVILDLLWNFAFLVGATVVFEVSKKEAPGMPLRLWIFGYAVQCMIHMVCVSFEYNRRRRQHIIGSDDNVDLQHCGGGSGGGGGGWWRRKMNSNSSLESDSRDYIPESSPQVEDETRYNHRPSFLFP